MRTEEGKVTTERDLHLRRRRATNLFLLAVGVLLAYLCFELARPFLTAIAWATILAVVFAPVHVQMHRWIKRENLSALASTSLTLLLGVLPLVLIVSAISREAAPNFRSHPR